ncbi:S-methyl-5'-thioadenosine phosphorylase [Selenomonadales bacterium OttesenSCG-928-I06]|nr:S-methyl-5'-thioadenosine phosphorylase [Selenomonadales bacterium OttesenSCG-928-I06]
MVRLAIIGGTGVYDFDMHVMEKITFEEIETPYGRVKFKIVEHGGRSVAFIPRHGAQHSIVPNKINYRANIWAIKKMGAESIISTSAVGSTRLFIRPGDFLIPHQFLDFTKSRESTFFDSPERGVVHVDLTNPYCSRMNLMLVQVAEDLGFKCHDRGTYVCTEGPRFETTAEIEMFGNLGGDVVGMTNVPEVVLAREAEICYSTICLVTNFGAGTSLTNLTHKEVVDTMKANMHNVRNFILAAMERIEFLPECPCRNSLAEYGGFKL